MNYYWRMLKKITLSDGSVLEVDMTDRLLTHIAQRNGVEEARVSDVMVKDFLLGAMKQASDKNVEIVDKLP